MSLAIHRLLRQDPTLEDLAAFVDEHTIPLAEGTSVTFLYQGSADRVELRHFIYGLESSQPFTRIAETDYWYLVMTLPEGSRVEYKIDVIRGDDHNWIRDPLNPHLAFDPFGANSVCQASGYERPEWTLPDPEARPGTLEENHLFSEAFGDPRHFQVYLPARFRTQRSYPLLVVHDGHDYLHYAGLQTVLDNLIHRLEIPPMIVALTNSPDRLVEYADDPRHGRFIVEELLPYLDEHYPLQPDPASRCLMGASFGGVASLATAWRYPGAFSRLLLQSGSFAFTDIGRHHRGPVFDPVVEFVNAFRADPGRPAERVFLSCGVYESLIYENRSMMPLLRELGLDVRYVEARDGHNWENWRDRLRQALSWLFPGPLWMVYE